MASFCGVGRPCSLFEASCGVAGSDPDAELYLPAAGSDNSFAYESIGAALLKCLIDGRSRSFCSCSCCLFSCSSCPSEGVCVYARGW